MKDIIYDLYVNKKMSTRDIARELQLSQTTIRRRMEKYQIAPRSQAESVKASWENEKYRSLEVRETRICKYCGSTFEVRPSSINICCSKECSYNYRSDKLSNKKIVICNNCGKEIAKIPSLIFSTNFCNRKCQGEWKSKYQTGENNPHYSRTVRYCSKCGRQLFIIKSRDINENVYCGIKCMGEHYSLTGRFSGENSPTWSGGKLTRNEYGPNWFRRRKQVRKRENYRCHRCGKTEEDNGEELSVHHIVNFKMFSSYKEANKMSNLVGLCRNCHTFIHSNLNTNNEYISEDIV